MENNISISSKVIKTEPIKWKELSFVQDENFKEWIGKGDEKLQQSLLKYQFIDPFKVWFDGVHIFCLDGKHRYLDLINLLESGIDVPEELPATFIDCRDMKEAAELVLIYSSQYAKITQRGLFQFVEKFQLNLDNMPEMNLPNFKLDELPLTEPSDLTAPKLDNPPVIKITFVNQKQMEQFEKRLQMMAEETELQGMKYSISLGEL